MINEHDTSIAHEIITRQIHMLYMDAYLCQVVLKSKGTTVYTEIKEHIINKNLVHNVLDIINQKVDQYVQILKNQKEHEYQYLADIIINKDTEYDKLLTNLHSVRALCLYEYAIFDTSINATYPQHLHKYIDEFVVDLINKCCSRKQFLNNILLRNWMLVKPNAYQQNGNFTRYIHELFKSDSDSDLAAVIESVIFEDNWNIRIPNIDLEFDLHYRHEHRIIMSHLSKLGKVVFKAMYHINQANELKRNMNFKKTYLRKRFCILDMLFAYKHIYTYPTRQEYIKGALAEEDVVSEKHRNKCLERSKKIKDVLNNYILNYELPKMVLSDLILKEDLPINKTFFELGYYHEMNEYIGFSIGIEDITLDETKLKMLLNGLKKQFLKPSPPQPLPLAPEPIPEPKK